MKKLIALFVVAAMFAACNNSSETATAAVDSATTTVDSAVAPVDTAAAKVDSAAAAIVDSAKVKAAKDSAAKK
jgi:PBP1b-binding outer membrane lipoprotein LpoB